MRLFPVATLFYFKFCYDLLLRSHQVTLFIAVYRTVMFTNVFQIFSGISNTWSFTHAQAYLQHIQEYHKLTTWPWLPVSVPFILSKPEFVQVFFPSSLSCVLSCKYFTSLDLFSAIEIFVSYSFAFIVFTCGWQWRRVSSKQYRKVWRLAAVRI